MNPITDQNQVGLAYFTGQNYPVLHPRKVAANRRIQSSWALQFMGCVLFLATHFITF